MYTSSNLGRGTALGTSLLGRLAALGELALLVAAFAGDGLAAAGGPARGVAGGVAAGAAVGGFAALVEKCVSLLLWVRKEEFWLTLLAMALTSSVGRLAKLPGLLLPWSDMFGCCGWRVRLFGLSVN